MKIFLICSLFFLVGYGSAYLVIDSNVKTIPSEFDNPDEQMEIENLKRRLDEANKNLVYYRASSDYLAEKEFAALKKVKSQSDYIETLESLVGDSFLSLLNQVILNSPSDQISRYISDVRHQRVPNRESDAENFLYKKDNPAITTPSNSDDTKGQSHKNSEYAVPYETSFAADLSDSKLMEIVGKSKLANPQLWPSLPAIGFPETLKDRLAGTYTAKNVEIGPYRNMKIVLDVTGSLFSDGFRGKFKVTFSPKGKDPFGFEIGSEKLEERIKMQIDSENPSVIMANGNTILQLFLDSNRRETVYVNIFLTNNGKSDSTSVLFKKQ